MPATQDPSPAPGALRLVQEFVNTTDLESGQDRIAEAQQLGAWLRKRKLLSGDLQVTQADADLAIVLREAMRALAWSNNGMSFPARTAELLNQVADETKLGIRFRTDGRAYFSSQAGGVGGALGQLYAVVVNAMAEGTWSRLKACLNPQCRWVFYDTSRNRSGTWCSMAVCGNRNKARTYRARHRTQ